MFELSGVVRLIFMIIMTLISLFDQLALWASFQTHAISKHAIADTRLAGLQGVSQIPIIDKW
jgi:hypothetical protein